MCSIIALVILGLASAVWAAEGEVVAGEDAPAASWVDVADFGAVGDGVTDNTEAFREAMRALPERGGVARVPAGQFLIAEHLVIPRWVTLEGVGRSPLRSHRVGTCLLAVEGKGDEDGIPFITLRENSTLSGLSVFYPEQVNSAEPHPYPWCVRGDGDNCSIINVLLVNPYLGVDFGTKAAGRHYVRGLYGHPLKLGLFIDRCFDVGRVEDVHFWPFWSLGPIRDFSLEHGTAFLIGRTDWEYMSNCFAIGYKVGFHFKGFENGPGNAVLTQCGSDVGPCAVLVEGVQTHAGVAFSNCQFMAGIDVRASNTGPVKFANCGFWGVDETTWHARLAGSGQVVFSSCHFNGWNRTLMAAFCIDADCEGLTVQGCDFMDSGNRQIRLGPKVKSAVVVGNRFRGGRKVEVETTGDVQMGLNSVR